MLVLVLGKSPQNKKDFAVRIMELYYQGKIKGHTVIYEHHT
jgi:hypothetical protein